THGGEHLPMRRISEHRGCGPRGGAAEAGMKAFTYTRASSVDDAVAAFHAHRDAKFLGGGTNLIDLMKMGVERPSHLIDVTRVPLNRIEAVGGGVRIGAMATNRDVLAHPLIRERYPVLSEALMAGASPQVRNM